MPPAPDWFWIVSPVLIIAGWFVVNWITSNREQRNWRRTTLLQAVTTLLEQSHRRHSLCLLDDWSTSSDARRIAIDQMTAAKNMFLICEAEVLEAAATEIITQHIVSDHAIQSIETSINNDSWNNATDKLSKEQREKHTLEAKMDAVTLKRSNDDLIVKSRAEVKQESLFQMLHIKPKNSPSVEP